MSSWACQEKVVPCPEGPFFTADRSGTKSPLDSPLGSAVQREIFETIAF